MKILRTLWLDPVSIKIINEMFAECGTLCIKLQKEDNFEFKNKMNLKIYNEDFFY